MSIQKESAMIFAKQALLPDGWGENVRVTLRGSEIETLVCDAAPQSGDTCVDTILPALGNLHSHAFQRAMAGLTEYRNAGRDSFWSWRSLMYRFLDYLTPDDMKAIAAQVYLEMQEAGYASVGEFHYVHHQPGGNTYNNLAETSLGIFEAARETGIGLTHLPVLYTYGGAERAALNGGQLRFGNDPDRFATLLDAAARGMSGLPNDARLGVAPHSLRAVDLVGLTQAQTMRPDDPIHIHIAEQPAEVQQIQDWLGARPVEWLMNNASLDSRWCLIHATHMTEAETVAMATSGAVAGLCPITEANLGDGPFNGPVYLAANGAFGIGSDSNVRISLTEELRMLEYSQRLRNLSRNVLTEDGSSVGNTLYRGAAIGGARALGRKAGRLQPGALADIVAINSAAASLCAVPQERLLDGLIFVAGDDVVTDLWSAGRHCVREGHHVDGARITTRFQRTMKKLADRL